MTLPAPRRRKPLQLLLQKVGQLRCRHTYSLVLHRHRMFLQCSACGRQTEGFQIGPKVSIEVGSPRRSA